MTEQPINLDSLIASIWALLSPAEQLAAAASCKRRLKSAAGTRM